MLKTKDFLTGSGLLLTAVMLSLTLANCNGSGFELADSCFNDGGDPLFNYSWYLANCGQKGISRAGGTSGVDLNLRATWSSGILGNGIKIRVSDDGLENTHEDLTGNFPTSSTRSRDYVSGDSNNSYLTTTAPPHSSSDNHGTSVAGIIAAVGGNGVGSRGVAPKATLAVANLLSSMTSQDLTVILNQATGTDFDILNMSWGYGQFELSPPTSAYEAQLKTAVTSYRNGKGAVLVKAAGNDYYTYCFIPGIDLDYTNADPEGCIGNSNFDGDNINPYQIIVAALDANGIAAQYSSPGANIWISGFGGMYGYAEPAMLTTDRMGCTNGWAKSSASAYTPFERGSAPNSKCNYTATFNGTSSAAPTISGAVALMLEANPSLTWRDVKYILAKTAVPMDYVTTGTIPHPLGLSVPAGYSWELPWKTNSAGFKFHNWYGFGKVDVDAAVAMAKSYTSMLGTFTEPNYVSSGTLNVSIGDGSLGGAAISQISISGGTASSVKIESVRIKVSVTHSDVSQLALELTSPSGMRSILVNMRNSLTNLANYSDNVFASNAFYQESSAGLWTLKVIDGVGDGTSGSLTKWEIQFTGAAQ
ncbi:S8 family serine peptidase [Bdellovibrio sp. SKB1291214]|uniref:S8 family serine peptidase n=1 Tax=Bdellovibrio sp. SKB1291214 TaxID=1732569 RepID=UPI000B51B3CD|nr:S8 family serine peptidase [Bdellovibrio sp. SKB1291214]UYL09515.1 S8 family serine peptidase [Bdellovibrio sp. SKB1291214]